MFPKPNFMKSSSLLRILTIPLSLLFILAGSCNKDNDEPTKTKTELLTSAVWKLASHITNPAQDLDGDGQSDDTDVLATYDACDKDDLTSFSANGSGQVSEGVLKCDPADPATYPFTWQWNSNETILSLLGQDFTLIELTSSTLKVSFTYSDSGVTYTETMTFTH